MSKDEVRVYGRRDVSGKGNYEGQVCLKRGKREEINMRAKVGTPWPKRDNQPICLFRFFSTREERKTKGRNPVHGCVEGERMDGNL